MDKQYQARWLCPMCMSGVAGPVENGEGECPCYDGKQKLIDVLEKPDVDDLASLLDRLLHPSATLNGRPMVPLHRVTIWRLLSALRTLQAENERLRAGLKQIGSFGDAALGFESCARDMRTTARNLIAPPSGEGAE